MEPDVGNENILIVSHEVFEDLLGRIHDVNVSPVDPGVLWLQGRVQQIVSRTSNSLAARSLGFEAVAIFDLLADHGSEVLLDDLGAAEGDLVLAGLDTIQLGSKHSHGVVRRVANQEGKIDQIMRVVQFREEIKVFGDIRCGILERCQDQDTFVVLGGLGRRLDRVQVDVLDGGGIDDVRLVMVENDWCL